MITIVLVSLIFLSLSTAVVIIAQYIPKIGTLPEEKIIKVLPKTNPLHQKALYFLVFKRRVLTMALLTKTIHRLKIISLRADNLATRLLVKIRSYNETIDKNGRYDYNKGNTKEKKLYQKLGGLYLKMGSTKDAKEVLDLARRDKKNDKPE